MVPIVTREEPQVSYGNSKKKEILTSTKDEALFHCGISREIPPSLLSLERILDTFEATQEVRRHTRHHSRRTPRVPPQVKKRPGFLSSSREEGPYLASSGKESWHSSRTSRGGSLNCTLEELQGSCFKRPRCHNVLEIHLTPLH